MTNLFTRSPISRRSFLGTVGGVAAASALGPRLSWGADELNVLVWCDHADPKLLQPFEQAHNVRVNVKTYEGTGTALSIIEQSQPGDWDVFVIDAPDVPQVAKQGLLAPLNKNDYPWNDLFEQIRNAPYGHDVRSMGAAMGGHWGSNVDRSMRAKQQAQKVNTSKADEEEDDITMA